MTYRVSPHVLLCLLLLAVGLGGVGPLLSPVHAEGVDPDRVRTEGLVLAYGRANGWPVKALALLTLGKRWHPSGAALVADAIASQDPKLRAFALEALKGTSPRALLSVLTPELVDQLIRWQKREKNARIRVDLLLLLARALPSAGARTPFEWATWWREAKETYQPNAWIDRVPPPRPNGESKTVPAPSIVHRALDLAQDGLQLVLVVDTTGSMQPTIDAVRTGLRDVVALLSGIAPEFELGLVHYRDTPDFPTTTGPGGGAQVVSRLSRNVAGVQGRLDRIAADGGGDYPERVSAGLWRALQRSMGWKARANKMVVIIGDAPPKVAPQALEYAKKARLDPAAFLGRSRRVVTGPDADNRPGQRPFVVSAVGVGSHGTSGDTGRTFREIARAGGGVYVDFSTTGDPEAVSGEIVSRLVELSFGARYMRQARQLVEIYRRYRDVGYIPK